MNTHLEKAYKQARYNYRNHILVRELDTPRYKGFKLYDPAQRRMGSLIILFTPEGIVLHGDGEITPHGTVSSYGYGLEWFAGKLDGSYLAEKFLNQQWVREDCAAYFVDVAQHLTEEADHADEEEEKDRLKANAKALWDLSGEILEEGLSEHDAYSRIEDLDDSHLDDGMPGYTYDYWQLAQLHVVQQKFAELYPGLPAAKETSADWLQQSETYRVEITRSMEKYSQQLGWGLTGAQGECWAMLDRDVEALAKLRSELPKLATNLANVQRGLCGHDHHAIRKAELQVLSIMDQMKALGVTPFAPLSAALANPTE